MLVENAGRLVTKQELLDRVWPETTVEEDYADEGQPRRPPGRYFRLLLIGYFEGLDAERAIAWRAADSFALRDFLGLGVDGSAAGPFDDLHRPDTCTNTRSPRSADELSLVSRACTA